MLKSPFQHFLRERCQDIDSHDWLFETVSNPTLNIFRIRLVPIYNQQAMRFEGLFIEIRCDLKDFDARILEVNRLSLLDRTNGGTIFYQGDTDDDSLSKIDKYIWSINSDVGKAQLERFKLISC